MMEYFITYIDIVIPACKRSPLLNQSCSERKVEHCPKNVFCKGNLVIGKPHPPNLCSTAYCRGERRNTCVADPCPRITRTETWRCSLKELPPEAKEEIEKELQSVDECGEVLILRSRSELGLLDPVTVTKHCGLMKEFRKLKSAYLSERYPLSDSESRHISCMLECQRLANDIRDTRVKYVQQLPTQSPPVTNAVSDTSSTSPDETKGRWVPLDEAAKLRRVKKKTLGTYRGNGITNPDGLSGKDEYEFFWKRSVKKGKNAATWYFIPHDFKPVNPDGD